MNETASRGIWLFGLYIATCCVTAIAQSDDTKNTVKIGYAALNFNASSGELTGPPGTTPAGATTGINNAQTAGLIYERKVSGPWSFVGQIGYPLTIQFKGAGTAAALGQVGSAKAWFPSALVTYSFAGPQTLRPYVGAGANYAFFTQPQAGPAYNGAFGGTSSTVGLKSSLGAVAKLGMEIPLSNTWVVDIAYSRYWIKTTATIVTATPNVGNIERKVDIKTTPEVFGVFLGYRF
ncbi:OmpW/AlkL family protein [Polaromonas sp. JS666]|uniref:OmpW/AlkL family protein n=1 Tax=Polaromonas sp. (strain JS666 / ATCC BAA-500) TaxID=296591 RepID=UPI0000531DD0|nr:OmpW family outer membrane protein [Polaromonas sp. JS666]ABE47334.1 OmpW [Polaromonas sp. JS666]